MAAVKVVMIGGKPVTMRASALLPRLYRVRFGRDMVSDMRQLQRAFAKAESLQADATEEEQLDAQLSVLDLTLFENVAYMMVKHGGEAVPDTPEEWLDSIDGIFPIYEILPEILDLWGMNSHTTSIPKKK